MEKVSFNFGAMQQGELLKRMSQYLHPARWLLQGSRARHKPMQSGSCPSMSDTAQRRHLAHAHSRATRCARLAAS